MGSLGREVGHGFHVGVPLCTHSRRINFIISSGQRRLATGHAHGGKCGFHARPRNHRALSGYQRDQWFLDAFKWNGTRLPGFPWSDGTNGVINTSPTLYDLDGDGKDKIIFTCGAKVIAIGAATALTMSFNSVTRQNYIPDGGYQVVTNGFYWYPSGNWISTLPSTAIFYSEVSPPMIADVGATGLKEVITAWKINPDSTGAGQDY